MTSPLEAVFTQCGVGSSEWSLACPFWKQGSKLCLLQPGKLEVTVWGQENGEHSTRTGLAKATTDSGVSAWPSRQQPQSAWAGRPTQPVPFFPGHRVIPCLQTGWVCGAGLLTPQLWSLCRLRVRSEVIKCKRLQQGREGQSQALFRGRGVR